MYVWIHVMCEVTQLQLGHCTLHRTCKSCPEHICKFGKPFVKQADQNSLESLNAIYSLLEAPQI